MEKDRTPVEAPLECYGLELDLAANRCRECPHQAGCAQVMDVRKGRITLDKLQWRLVPENFGVELRMLATDDPDRHRINRVYQECYRIIFKRAAPDATGRLEREILLNVKEANCSVRVYILANMLGWAHRNDLVDEHDPDGRILAFTASRLKGAAALARARTYQDLCRRSFGTFSPSALETLTGTEIIDNEFASQMYDSEVIAGAFIIGHKLQHQGSGFNELFRRKEPHLNEIWLAIESEYMARVLEWRKEPAKRSIRTHRQGVLMAHGEMKKRREYAIGAFEARQQAMPRAVATVLQRYGYRPVDFEMPATPIQNALRFWVLLGRAVCQMECLNYLEGQPSFYDRA